MPLGLRYPNLIKGNENWREGKQKVLLEMPMELKSSTLPDMLLDPAEGPPCNALETEVSKVVQEERQGAKGM